jgi:glutamate-1-semialdehyde aminotransferase
VEDKRSLEKSLALFVQGLDCIYSLVQYYDEGSGEHVTGRYPRFIQSGKGTHIYDVDGNEYIDFDMGLGPIILGYCYEAVDKAVAVQLGQGMHFTLVSPQEVEYAQMLQKHIPCAGKVRFFKTGSSACEAAIRTARAYTGKKHMIRGDYHGWHEWTIAAEGVRQGGILPEVRQYTHRCRYNALSQFEEVFAQFPGDVAAVMLEPLIIEEPQDNFLQNLQDLCRHNGALLIFDEVVTGFRFDIGGAQRVLGITPDLAVFGKGAANGMPLSFVCGKKEILDSVEQEVYFFTTFSGERLSLAAGMAVLRELETKSVTEKIWAIGSELKTRVNEMAQRLGVRIELLGTAPRLAFVFRDRQGRFDTTLKNIFMQECIKRGVFLGWTVFPCFAHSREDIATALTVFEDAMKICQKHQNAADEAVAAWLSWGRKQ